MSAPSRQIIAIDPARLARGEWCHRAETQLGEGDVPASYSADRIGMGQPIRKPFRWQGGLWVCVSICRDGSEAYRLLHLQAFDGPPTSYGEKCRDGDAARADLNGFYHGMRVRHAGAEMVLCGPPVILVPGEVEQMGLF
ncbi:hypothetical protein [Acuticoccus sediminis]|uniref:hypothetical protein n=1 Tax=Acuticoccus sediminis TaxID=2184697 RepID=UPI001CFCA095|nr:hypothetical protein [Acuticoccus sediminis]